MSIAFRYAILMFILCGLLYPLAITGIGQILFPDQANGSLIRNTHGQTIGSRLIAQEFSHPEYFHPRPSANNYDASNSGGSNYGPTSKKLMDRIDGDLKTFQKENPFVNKLIPVDAVTASGSGLDPDISLANAYAQAPRIAQTRHIKFETIRELIQSHSEADTFGALGEPCVNVLELNLALDKKQGK